MYIKIKKELEDTYKAIAKNGNIEVKDLVNDAASFYLAYLGHLKNEQIILFHLKNIKANVENKEVLSSEQIEEIKKTHKQLCQYFFQAIDNTIDEILSINNQNLKQEPDQDELYIEFLKNVINSKEKS